MHSSAVGCSAVPSVPKSLTLAASALSHDEGPSITLQSAPGLQVPDIRSPVLFSVSRTFSSCLRVLKSIRTLRSSHPGPDRHPVPARSIHRTPKWYPKHLEITHRQCLTTMVTDNLHYLASSWCEHLVSLHVVSAAPTSFPRLANT